MISEDRTNLTQRWGTHLQVLHLSNTEIENVGHFAICRMYVKDEHHHKVEGKKLQKQSLFLFTLKQIILQYWSTKQDATWVLLFFTCILFSNVICNFSAVPLLYTHLDKPLSKPRVSKFLKLHHKNILPRYQERFCQRGTMRAESCYSSSAPDEAHKPQVHCYAEQPLSRTLILSEIKLRITTANLTYACLDWTGLGTSSSRDCKSGV